MWRNGQRSTRPDDRAFRPRSTAVVGVVVSLALGAPGWAAQTAQTRRPPRPPVARELPRDLALLQEAGQALARGDLARAERLAGEAALESPTGRVIAARAALVRGRHEDAERLLRQAVESQPGGEASLELGLLLQRSGRDREARALLASVVAEAPGFEFPAEFMRAGRAARALGNYRQANAFFRSASNGAPTDPAVQTAWGDLFLEKYSRQDAVRSYQAALRGDANWAPARVGLARALAPDNPPRAAAMAREALSANPYLSDAWLLIAELALDEGRRQDAAAALDEALKIDARHLEALSLGAAIAWLDGRTADYEAGVARVLSLHPSYGEVYRVVGEHVARAYRFEEAVTFVRRALELDPASSRAHASLGAHLLRTGDEAEAREALEKAFRADPFDVVTYNMLGLLDTLDKFDTIEDRGVILRLDPSETAVLRQYAVPLVHETLGRLRARYGVDPRGPVLVEIFPRHDDFAVRTAGLPGMIGALGACFGRVVTMDSPRARPPGFFSWQATLWHELAHVITLQLSNQRVPRWLTEGISVYEEREAREAWGREGEMTFVRALGAGRTIPLPDLNAAFSDPERISLAYFQASLLVEHLVERFGAAKLKALVEAYRTALDPAAPIAPVLGEDLAGLQPSFDAFIERRYGLAREAMVVPEGFEGALASAGTEVGALARLADAHAGSYAAQLAVGEVLVGAGANDEARRVLDRALPLMPLPTGTIPARNLLAEVSVRQGDAERAKVELEAVLAADGTALDAARRLAELSQAPEDGPRMRRAAERIIAVNPFDALPHAMLGKLALAAGDLDTALREFRVALDAGPSDLAAAHTDLAVTYFRAGRVTDAKQSAIAALEIAPRYEKAQELLLSIVDKR